MLQKVDQELHVALLHGLRAGLSTMSREWGNRFFGSEDLVEAMFDAPQTLGSMS